MQLPKAIYFDLDNTLVDRNRAFTACLGQFFDAHLPHYYFGNEQYELEEIDNWGYTDLDEFVEWFIQHYQPSGWDESSVSNYIITNISSFIPASSAQLINLLQHLKQQCRIGIITNGSITNQSRKIKQAKLDQCFSPENIHISQQYQLAKPDAAFFSLVLEQWGYQGQDVWYIGDDPINDIEGAKQLDMTTVWVHHQRPWTQDFDFDFSVNSVLDLGTLLDL